MAGMLHFFIFPTTIPDRTRYLYWWKVSTTEGLDTCIGGQSLVQPSGTIIVPSESASIESIIAWQWTEVGKLLSWLPW